MREKYIWPTAATDRLCGVALAGLLLAVTVCFEVTDGAAMRTAQVDKPSAAAEVSVSMDCLPLVEAVEAMQADPYDETIPLDRACQEALRETCEASGVPVALALALIEVESRFEPEAVSREGSYGLCQLNPKYFPAGLAPEDNIRAGIGYLGELLDKHGDVLVALTCYNAGHDTGGRTYAGAVLAAAERWEETI